MGNYISNDKANESLPLSNGATDVLLSVLLLAGSTLAQTVWEKELMVWFAEHDQAVFGRGLVGFDIDEIAWNSNDFLAQKDFLLKMIDLALQRHRWQLLDYDPPYATEYLSKFKQLVELFTVEMINPQQDWQWRQPPEQLSLCPKHGVYQHANCCLICGDQ